jgi:hypothetical protein
MIGSRHGNALLGTVAAVGLLLVPGAAPAAARVRVSARIPLVTITGETVRVGVRVRGLRGSARVVLEQRVPRRGWAARVREVAPGGSSSLAWRAPGVAGVVVVRVVLTGHGRLLAATRARRVAVSATTVLAPSRVVAAPPPGTAGQIRYRGTAAVRAGSFVAADAGPATPFGLLGRVVAESIEARDTVLDVVPATLVEAVPEGHVAAVPSAPPAARAAGATPRRFASALACDGDAGARLDGSLAVTLEPAFELDWSWGEIERAQASVTLRGKASLSARLGGAGSCSLPETSVGGWDAPPLRFFAGPIPVVIVPRTTLYLSGRAEAGAGVETGVSGSVSATAGLRYDGDVHPLGAFDAGFSYTAPTAVAKAGIGARVTPSVTFLLYGAAGPRFDLSTGLQLDASPASTPWWTLSAPVELSAGLELPGLDGLSVPQQTVYSTTIPVAQAEPDAGGAGGDRPGAGAGGGAGTGDAGAGAGGSGDAGAGGAERARIAWDTGATDVDLHVWDERGNHASYTKPDGVPGGRLSEDDRHGFGPESFLDGAGPRTLTFGLCYFDDHGAGPTKVAVRLTDPDGTVHESTETLARKGDSVLLGSSPAGAAFTPPDGWCDP